MASMDRRRFIQGSLATAATLGAGSDQAGATPQTKSDHGRLAPPAGADALIDVNVSLFHWPFDRMRGDETPALVRMLAQRGVKEAWAGTLEGVFHKDMRAVNARLAEHCKRYGEGMLVPFGSVNPMWPDWREDLRRCHEKHGMPGIRLHPNYHRYQLDDPLFNEVVSMAAKRDLIVQIVPWMEDPRHHHPLMPVPTADVTPLADMAKKHPDVRFMVLNGFRSPGRPALQTLKNIDNVHFDFTKLDVLNGLDRLLNEVPLERVVFGSHSPMFYFESARLKIQEAGLTEQKARALCRDNARRLRSGA